MRRGPKGASIETQLEVTATRTWRFSRDELVKRLGLPDDARIYVSCLEGEVDANSDGEGRVKITISDNSAHVPLTAVATETRKPAVKP